MASITLDSVTKCWGSHTAVDNLSLTVSAGEFVVLLGPSGCGKSTTLRMIAGLEPLTSGRIKINDQLVDHLEPSERNIAMVFQDYGLYPSMSVYENILFPLKVRNVPKAEQHERVKQAAGRVQLTELLDRQPMQLSGGQQQRVALARAIVRKPQVFLMDEPLSSLDAQLRLSMRAEIRNLQHRLGTTTLYVTHDQQEAMTLADRVIVLKNGTIQQVGSPDTVYQYPANVFVAGFIGSPPMNLVDGNLSDGVFTGYGLRVAGLPATYNGDVTLGFRANHIQCLYGDFSSANLHATVYAVENLGETTQIVLKASAKGTASSHAQVQQNDQSVHSDEITLRITTTELPVYRKPTEIGDRLAAHVDAAACLLFKRPGGQLISHTVDKFK